MIAEIEVACVELMYVEFVVYEALNFIEVLYVGDFLTTSCAVKKSFALVALKTILFKKNSVFQNQVIEKRLSQ